MKLNARTSAEFLAAPDKSAHACLVYGPDSGLVQEQCKTIRKNVLGEQADDFAFVEMDFTAIIEDTTRLTDELRTVHMLADKRLIFIRSATDKLLTAIENSAEHWHSGAFLLVTAGELAPRSHLRKWFEKAKNAGCLPCYHDDARSLRQVMQQRFAAESIQVSSEVYTFLLQHLGNDRRVTLAELEKICLYIGKGGTLTMGDARLLVDHNRESQLDDMAASVADRNLKALEKELQQAMQEQLAPVMYIRALQRYFNRLYQVRSQMDAGVSQQQAMSQLKPPVFFKEQERFARHVRAWETNALAAALARMVQAERACKTSDLPLFPASSRALFQATQARG